jgi:flagella synthesis protein FlgN
VLQREQAALTQGSTDALMTLAAEKVRHAERLAILNQEREVTLRAAGLDSGRAGIQALSSAGSLPIKVQNDLATVIELAKESRRLNELNGKLVADRLQHNQQALNVLLSAAKQSTLYGPDGQTRVGPAGRTLGSA